MRRYPALIFVSIPMGDCLCFAPRRMCQTVAKHVNSCPHALDMVLDKGLVFYFLRTVHVHLDGIWFLAPSPQPAASWYLVHSSLVIIAIEKPVCIKKFENRLFELNQQYELQYNICLFFFRMTRFATHEILVPTKTWLGFTDVFKLDKQKTKC